MSRKSSTSSADTQQATQMQPPPYSEKEKPTEKDETSLVSSDDIKDVEYADKKLRYPYAVFFIVINEFCERFSYYGMRTVLTLYFHDVLLFDEDLSTVMYHVFVMLCYFTPIFGAILADTLLGKFRTILYLSILYACGNILLSGASIPNGIPQVPFSLIGLLIIAIGTGGIKPCVSAFGGDQFVRPQQDKQLEQFFSIFYFSINAGSLISTLVTPILRQDVKCFDGDTCFPLAFGVPAVLMIVAIIVFVSGKWQYTIRAPEGNVMVDVSKCVSHAIKRKWKNRKTKAEKHSHWLDFASDKYDAKLISDIKRVFQILILYIPIPIFWALFDQQGSRWTFQATRMDGTLGGTSIKPDQMQVVNPLLILIMVPIFEGLIYPLFAKCKLLTPLQRIATGGVLAGVAFCISAVVELQLEPTYPVIPAAGRTQLNFLNSLPCEVNVHVMGNIYHETIKVNASEAFYLRDLENIEYQVTASIEACQKYSAINGKQWNGKISGGDGKVFSVLITAENDEPKLFRMMNEDKLEKSSSGFPEVRFVYNWNWNVTNGVAPVNGTIKLRGPEMNEFAFSEATMHPDESSVGQTEFKIVELGIYDVLIPQENGILNDDPAASVELRLGGSYVIVVQHSLTGNEPDVQLVVVTPPNSVHMLWLIPQYFVMTMAEVMFSVTGLQFSFTQAPVSMRSVMQALWQLTIAFGNLIVIIVAETKGIPRQSMEFFLFAGLMFADMILFAILAARYQYVEPEQVEDNKEEKKKPLESGEQAGLDNKAFNDTAM